LQECATRRRLGKHILYSWECRRVWKNEPSYSQVNSYLKSWSPDGFSNFQKAIVGSKPIGLKIPLYYWKNIEMKISKMSLHDHLDIWNTSYDQKKGWGSNWQLDFRALKVKNWLDFLVFRWRATYYRKDLDEGYNFTLYLISIKGPHTKLWGPKAAGVPTLRILGLSFYESWDKMPFGCACTTQVGLGPKLCMITT